MQEIRLSHQRIYNYLLKRPQNCLTQKGLLKAIQSNFLAVNRDTYSQIRVLKAWSSQTLSVSKNRAFTTFLGNMCQCLTTLVKKFYLISNLNLPSFSLRPFPLVLSQQTLLKSTSFYFYSALLILKGCYHVSPQPSIFQAEQPQVSQPVLIWAVLHPLDHFCGPPLEVLQQVLKDTSFPQGFYFSYWILITQGQPRSLRILLKLQVKTKAYSSTSWEKWYQTSKYYCTMFFIYIKCFLIPFPVYSG